MSTRWHALVSGSVVGIAAGALAVVPYVRLLGQAERPVGTLTITRTNALWQVGATGPTVVWTSDGANVEHFEVCVDSTDPKFPCPYVGASPNQNVNGLNTYAWRLATPLAPQAHVVLVRACNALGCVDSDPYAIGLPTKPIVKVVR